MVRVLFLFCLTASIVSSPGTVAQTPDTAPSSSQPLHAPGDTTLKVTTKLTVENITVTDSKGQPVHGLTQADFTVKEDGKPQPIRNFEEYGSEKPAVPAAPLQLPPNVYTNRPQIVATTGAVNILMFDNVSTGLANHLKLSPEYFMVARQQALKYLQKMPSGTQVAILDLTDGLQVVQGFTSDRALLLAAVESTSTKPFLRAVLRDPPPRIEPPELCLTLNTQSRLALEGLNQAAAFVSGIKGRKNLIWFTPGIPWLTDYPSFNGIACLTDYTRELHKAYDLLTTAQVALYPVDPRGVFGNPASGAATGGAPRPGAEMGFLVASGGDQDSLTDMAEATGGIAYMNRNDLDAAIGEAVVTGSDYYSLAYVPPLSKYDGQHHTINIQVDRPGVHLNYRQGYNSDDPTQPAKAAKKKDAAAESGVKRSALSVSMGREVPTSSELQFDVRIEAEEKPSSPPVIGALDPKLKSKSLTRYDVHYMVPADHVTFTDAPDGGRKSSVVLDIAAYGEDGKLATFLSQPASLPISAQAYENLPAVTLRCVQQIDLPSGQVFLRVGILDTASNRLGTLEIPLKVRQ